MQQKLIKGKLENLRELHGWSGDLELTITGEKFYLENSDDEVIQENIGKDVTIVYHSAKKRLSDWIMDRLAFASYGIPRTYNKILQVKVK